jgi:nicotinamide-nucleotide amidase
MPTAEIIAIGTELLLGETADTNTRFIARVLRNLGIDLFRTQTIGDNPARITDAVRQALERADFVITTGGLGPTVDDPTRQSIADVFGTPLEFHPELWEQIEGRIARYGRTPTGNQKRQAYIPKNAIVIENPVGTAPAFIVNGPCFPQRSEEIIGMDKCVISLPGVPSEMETLLTEVVVPYLQKFFDLHEVLTIHTLHVSGLGEGLIDDLISDMELLANPTVGLSAHPGLVDIRISAKAENIIEADRMIASVEKELRHRLGDHIFGVDDETLETTALDNLAQHGWVLSTIESGLDDKLMTRLNRTGHSAYRGGRCLQIEEEMLVKNSKALLQEMNTTVVLGTMLSNSGLKQDIFIFIITPNGSIEKHLAYGGHPANAQHWAINMALDELRRSTQESR